MTKELKSKIREIIENLHVDWFSGDSEQTTNEIIKAIEEQKDTFEYKIVSTQQIFGSAEKLLNQKLEDGWEPVSMSQWGKDVMFLFRRYI